MIHVARKLVVIDPIEDADGLTEDTSTPLREPQAV